MTTTLYVPLQHRPLAYHLLQLLETSRLEERFDVLANLDLLYLINPTPPQVHHFPDHNGEEVMVSLLGQVGINDEVAHRLSQQTAPVIHFLAIQPNHDFIYGIISYSSYNSRKLCFCLSSTKCTLFIRQGRLNLQNLSLDIKVLYLAVIELEATTRCNTADRHNQAEKLRDINYHINT
jgi:hypothetical protein